MSRIIINDVYQVSVIMNDSLNLNNQVRLFQTQICVYIFHEPTVRTPTLARRMAKIETRAKNGENEFLLRVASVAKRECDP